MVKAAGIWMFEEARDDQSVKRQRHHLELRSGGGAKPLPRGGADCDTAAALPHCRALASVRGAEASTFENGAGAGG